MSKNKELTVEEVKMLRNLRDKKGFAVVLFTAEELDGATAEDVENRLIELGWDVINDLKEV